MYRRFVLPGIMLGIIIVVGTGGYWLLSERQVSLIDALYMTVITITTIGYGEIVDLAGNTGGRIFTMFIAVSGIGVLAYTATNFTALIVEGELRESFRRRRMEKAVGKYEGHYIVCGVGLVGVNILNELRATKRSYVIVDIKRPGGGAGVSSPQDDAFIEGDATDNNTLTRSGISRAKGLFAVTGDDNINLVISLTAKQLNPRVKVVTECNDVRNADKLKRAGADAVVSPSAIGGLRMASEMTRPAAVSFLDTMLRDTGRNLRVEEVAVPDLLVGRRISDLNLKRFPNVLLLAIRTSDDWRFNPPESHLFQHADVLVVMSTPEDRLGLEKDLATL